ncbi:MAG: alkane 1-monooxygenase [Planctomycetota bacterium]
MDDTHLGFSFGSSGNMLYFIDMNTSDIKYVAAYLLPASGFVAVLLGGVWSLLTVLVAFVMIPLAEALLPISVANHPADTEATRRTHKYFSLLLYCNVPIVYGLLLLWLYLATNYEYAVWEIICTSFSVGVVMAANGINVAHELGHRASAFERFLSKLLLLPCMYMQFFIEHNRGHHFHVATRSDPATARYGEALYSFWFRALYGIVVSSWRIEQKRLKQKKLSVYSWQNDLLRFFAYQLFYLFAVFFVFGWLGLGIAVFSALVAVLMLETIDYIEHYGLRRLETSPGKIERVMPKHSWNSNHILGRVILYELTRHSDHHAVSSRQYQVLKHHDESPQLPLGYPGSMLLALVPPLWFRIVNPRVPQSMVEQA